MGDGGSEGRARWHLNDGGQRGKAMGGSRAAGSPLRRGLRAATAGGHCHEAAQGDVVAEGFGGLSPSSCGSRLLPSPAGHQEGSESLVSQGTCVLSRISQCRRACSRPGGQTLLSCDACVTSAALLSGPRPPGDPAAHRFATTPRSLRLPTSPPMSTPGIAESSRPGFASQAFAQSSRRLGPEAAVL